MANVYLDDSLLTSIGNSIRGKNGSTDTYTPAQMATAIDNLSSATLGTKSITANGTYNASDDSLDGYSSVEVNVASSGSSLPYVAGTSIGGITSSTTATSQTVSYTPVQSTGEILCLVGPVTTSGLTWSSDNAWTKLNNPSTNQGYAGASEGYWHLFHIANTGAAVSMTANITTKSTYQAAGILFVEIANYTFGGNGATTTSYRMFTSTGTAGTTPLGILCGGSSPKYSGAIQDGDKILITLYSWTKSATTTLNDHRMYVSGSSVTSSNTDTVRKRLSQFTPHSIAWFHSNARVYVDVIPDGWTGASIVPLNDWAAYSSKAILTTWALN